MKLESARKFAMAVVGALAPYCERIEIAGSIRRGRPEVNDADIVLLPSSPEAKAAALQRAAEHCKADKLGPVNYRFLAKNDFPLELYFATPRVEELLNVRAGNYGSLLLCRTGSKDFNVWFASEARRRGLKWKPYAGIVDRNGGVVASESEIDLFRAIGLKWVRPEERER